MRHAAPQLQRGDHGTARPPIVCRPPANEEETCPPIERERRRIVLGDLEKNDRASAGDSAEETLKQGSGDASPPGPGAHAESKYLAFPGNGERDHKSAPPCRVDRQ